MSKFSMINGAEKEKHVIVPDDRRGTISLASRIYDATEITVSKTVNRLHQHDFYQCTLLKKINLPDSIESIEDMSIYSCRKLMEINVDPNNRFFCSIDGNLYTRDQKTLLRYAEAKPDVSFTVPNTVTKIGAHAFFDAVHLESIILPQGLTEIEKSAFNHCASLKSITIPQGVKTLSKNSFSRCSSLAEVRLHGKVERIEEQALSVCDSLVNITLPKSIVHIGEEAFYNCKLLERVDMPECTANFGKKVFDECSRLEKITAPLQTLFRFAENNSFPTAIRGLLRSWFAEDNENTLSDEQLNKLTDFTTDICNYSLHDVISTNSFIEFAINTRILKTDAAELLLSLCKSTELRSILLNYINETNSYNDNFDNYKI